MESGAHLRKVKLVPKKSELDGEPLFARLSRPSVSAL